MLIGAQVAGRVYNRFLGGAQALTLDQWARFWWLPSAFAAAVLVFFAIAFREKERVTAGAPVRAPAVGA